MTFEFGSNGRVIVERGAMLTLDNCVLKGLKICHTMWQGIEVWGISSVPHFPISGQIQQGKLIRTNTTITYCN